MGDTQPIRRASLVDEIFARVRSEIMEGRWAAGQTLPPERELAERWGVTRTSLKHALVRLEEVGLVRTKHGVGTVVQDVAEDGGADLLKYMVATGEKPSSLLLREVLEARSFIAGGFGRLAARRRTRKQIEEMEATLDRMAVALDRPLELQRLENDFVRALARAGQNRVFVFITNSVSAAYRLDLGTYAAPFADGKWVLGSLRRILQAVGDGDEEAARKATERYFDECARRVVAAAR